MELYALSLRQEFLDGVEEADDPSDPFGGRKAQVSMLHVCMAHKKDGNIVQQLSSDNLWIIFTMLRGMCKEDFAPFLPLP
jgi:hypothetical protein